MAAPNLKAPTTITGKTVLYNCTDTLSSALSNTAASGKVFKVNTIRAANVDAASAVTVDLSVYRNTTHTYLAKVVSVPFASTFVLLAKDEYLYLEEGDALYAKCGTTTKIDLSVSYEEIS